MSEDPARSVLRVGDLRRGARRPSGSSPMPRRAPRWRAISASARLRSLRLAGRVEPSGPRGLAPRRPSRRDGGAGLRGHARPGRHAHRGGGRAPLRRAASSSPRRRRSRCPTRRASPCPPRSTSMAVAAEALSLALPPYPRAPGAELGRRALRRAGRGADERRGGAPLRGARGPARPDGRRGWRRGPRRGLRGAAGPCVRERSRYVCRLPDGRGLPSMEWAPGSPVRLDTGPRGRRATRGAAARQMTLRGACRATAPETRRSTWPSPRTR